MMNTPLYRRSMAVLREVLARLGVTGLGLLMLTIFLIPLGYVLATAFKEDSQLTTPGAPLWPAAAATYNYQGQDYPLYEVPTENGGTRRIALVSPHRENSDVVDPAHPEQGIFNLQGRWRTWKADYRFTPAWENFTTAWRQVNFLRLFRNSFLLSTISTIGTLIACILVAYGFTRFELPGKNILFIILISVYHFDLDHRLASTSHDRPALYSIQQTTLDRYLAATIGAGIFRQCL